MEELAPDQCTQRSDSPSLPFPGPAGVGGVVVVVVQEEVGRRQEPRHGAIDPATLPTCWRQLRLSRRSRHRGRAASDGRAEKTAVICL